MSTPQEEDAGSLLPALLAIYTNYLAFRAAQGNVSTAWTIVVDQIGLQAFIGDQLAMIAARALARQREGLGPGADELWTAVPQGVAAGVNAGLQTVAEALIWTDEHEDVPTKDEDGLIPTQSDPPEELAMVTAQAVASAAQEATAEAAGWRYKTWETIGDRAVRETHRALSGKKIRLTEAFVTTDGDSLRYPGDPLAEISNRIGCRCTLRTSR